VRKPRVLIANRGEIAVRIIRTLRELDVPSIAVYSDADRDALHVEMADAAYRIGPPLATDSYLSIGATLEAARRSRATAIHPGYGFLSESSHFAQAVTDGDYTFIGPPASAIELMGDKAAARRAAEAAGVPIVPGTTEPVSTSEAPGLAEEIGYPIAVKAAFGGGGRGMHVVRHAKGLASALERAEREARAYFGRPEVFMERYIENAHHVEAQILADERGNVWFLGERDCSVQRRHQKLIEETPSPIVDEETRTRIGDAAIALAKAAGYANAGTVEFVMGEDGAFYFLEMNTRLQVEHTVTEMATGLDLVALQLRIALGEEVDVDAPPRGASIQCRINAEDPTRNFLPGPGRVTAYVEPAGPFVRVDSGVRLGKEIPGDYDSMFAKLVVWGSDREEARKRMLRALGEYQVEGVPTTIPLHRWTLQTKEFREGSHTTTWIERALRDADLEQTAEQIPTVAPGERGPSELLLEVDGKRVPVRIYDERTELAPRPPSPHGGAAGEHVHGIVAAPMQGKILRVLVEQGQAIQAGDVLCILEAMKMENHIQSPREGVVTELPIEPNQAVVTGQTLAVID
jgi:acetyl-CoA/propionyl-CoA carboxylase, biotin carboxylase, biotin carboxyl carrier protein